MALYAITASSSLSLTISSTQRSSRSDSIKFSPRAVLVSVTTDPTVASEVYVSRRCCDVYVLERGVALVQLLVDGLRLREAVEHQAEQHLLQLVGRHELREDPNGSQTDGGLGHVGQHGDHQVLQNALQRVEKLVGLLLLLGLLLGRFSIVVLLGRLGIVLLGVLLVLDVGAQCVERVEVLLARHAALTGPGQAVLAVRMEPCGLQSTSKARSETP